MTNLRTLTVAAALLFTIAACGANDPATETRLGATPPCTTAADLFTDAADGILNDAEFREEFQGVARRARGTAVENEARALMIALTNGDDPTEPVGAFMDACSEALER